MLAYLKTESPLLKSITFLAVVFAVIVAAYFIWSPGRQVRDGRHDLRKNGIWIQHGWLGHNSWFSKYNKNKSLFRDADKIKELAGLFADHGIKYVFPHLCPCRKDGTIAEVDSDQTELFLHHFEGFKVMPWIGGVLNVQCFPGSAEWRSNFVSTAVKLLHEHPRLGGVHVNIEPMPTGNMGFLALLAELRKAMPKDKILSLAAYPPPTLWHPFPEVHWEESYFRSAASNVDQVAVMMYDTAIRFRKPYINLISDWTGEIITRAEGTRVLLGAPAYDDEGVGYHYPKIENLENFLAGIHAGLAGFSQIPNNYEGVAIYCEWEMDDLEWLLLKREFGKE